MLQSQDALDQAFQALADPTRRAMIERLSRGPVTVSELAAPFDMSLTAVMQHLKVLEGAGLVASEKIGRTRTCRVEREALTAAERWLNDRRQSAERALDRLGQFLEETNDTDQ